MKYLLVIDTPSLCYVLNIDAFSLLLVNFEVSLGRVDQIIDLLVVYLAHAYLHTKLDLFAGGLDPIEYCPHHSGNNPLKFDVLRSGSLHCVGFPR